MSGWKDIFLDMLKLTDETKRLNKDVDKLNDKVAGIDKRVVRLETIVEIGLQVQEKKAMKGDSSGSKLVEE